jgi:hypothetical protein
MLNLYVYNVFMEGIHFFLLMFQFESLNIKSMKFKVED